MNCADGNTMPSPETQDLDISDWAPLSPTTVVDALRGCDKPFWIAGGWALDLLVGEQTREHRDTDVLILTRDQLAIQRHLSSDWVLYKTQQPTPSKLAPWPAGEYLPPESGINDIWVKNEVGGPWVFQIMFLQSSEDHWTFRRDERLGGPLSDIGWETPEGLPVLSPQIQLLFKGAKDRRPKDDADFHTARAHLSDHQQRWLARGLRLQFGDDHEWLEFLESASSLG
ncbi:MAG: hypothetical protein HOG99_26265 [Gemmatimonadetes bacterium]|nr:hypothetical protein [Gemmatimonadota bacterium]MBT5965064.1 hypothetical protein [Gemmatimonadota bacterium]MBT6625433.1 hypothetical protein [Gemmatimonadota bacterium]MBT7455581.1 hypothetical protein [Gemmatimonadota bacterium]